MKLKGAASVFGSVGILLPLILIFLIATDAAYACPGTATKVVYRTRTVNTRTGPLMGTTVISYGGQPCGQSMYAPRPTRYVAVRGNSYYSPAPRYVAVRSADSYYPVRRTRYIAVRNDDIDYAPNYVVVRRQPAYVDTGARYVAVRNYAPRTRYVAVRDTDTDDVDYDYSPQYVAVRRYPVYDSGPRYVAVRHVDNDYDDDDYVAPTRYVAVRNVRNACACAGELQSSLDQIETVSPRHVVVKSDYLAGTQDVIVPRSSYDDTAYLTVPTENISRARYVDYSDATYLDDNDATYVPARYIESPRIKTVSYVPTYNDSDIDDEAIPDTDDVAYVTTGDVGDACLSRVAVQAPMEMETQTVSYVPVQDVDYNTSLSGSGATYIVNKTAAPAISYVPVVDEDSDLDTTYVAANNTGASCSCPIASRTFVDDIGFHTVTPISAANVETVNTVPVSYSSVEDVNYIPIGKTNVEPVSYVPAESVGYADTADTDADDYPTSETSVVTEPVSVANSSTTVVEPVDTDMSVDLNATQASAGDAGYRDGLADGKAAALNGEENRPGDSANFQNPTNGYNETLGDINAYSDAYRSSYLQGFSAGYNSAVGSE